MDNLKPIGDALAELTGNYAAVTNNKDAAAEESREVPSINIAAGPFSTYPDTMNLNIGGRHFMVSRTTLMESGLFQHQLSDHFTWSPQADGSYFMDADPVLFEHLLAFMRRPEIFPVFYTSNSGFDYHLYSRLQVEAEYFQIDALYDWIKEKKYLKAVIIQTYQARVKNLDQKSPERYSANEDEERHILPRTKKIYVCPRGIPVHRGSPGSCGHACHKAQGDNVNQYEEENYVEVVVVKKVVEFVDAACRLE
jgi:hypothetical protein